MFGKIMGVELNGKHIGRSTRIGILTHENGQVTIDLDGIPSIFMDWHDLQPALRALLEETDRMFPIMPDDMPEVEDT